jgi:hypothetical protein
VIIGSKSENRIRTILDERLGLLCTALRIDSDGPARYRELSLFLLAHVIGLRGFQVLEKRPPGRGGTVFWTVQKQFALIKFVDEQLEARTTPARAFALARDELAPGRADDTVKVAYHRAKRLFAANPRTAKLLALIDRSPKVARKLQLLIASPTMLMGKRR